MIKRDHSLSFSPPLIGSDEIDEVVDSLRSDWITTGPKVRRFEEAFAAWIRTPAALALNSCTGAMHVALAAVGIGPGDAVVTTAMTFCSSVHVIEHVGALPILVDVEPDTLNIDPAKIAEAIDRRKAQEARQRVRAILPVHLYGHPCDMDPLRALSEKHGVHLVEDAAEAHGATYRSRRAGSLGKLACFSFYANKIISTGEGGMVLTDDATLAARCRKLRNQAHEDDHRFRHRELGFNYRLTNLQAAIGLAQLERIEEFVEIRRRNARLYTELLRELPGLTPPPEAPWARALPETPRVTPRAAAAASAPGFGAVSHCPLRPTLRMAETMELTKPPEFPENSGPPGAAPEMPAARPPG